jgi:hypothetical protein
MAKSREITPKPVTGPNPILTLQNQIGNAVQTFLSATYPEKLISVDTAVGMLKHSWQTTEAALTLHELHHSAAKKATKRP